MSETTLKERLGLHPGANTTPKKAWKKPKKPHSGDHQQAAWPRRADSSSSYEAEEGYQPSGHVAPSLFDRLGPKIDPPIQPRSLLERMELQDDGATEAAATGVADASEVNLISLDAVHTANGNGDEDGGIAVDDSSSARYDFSEEDGMPDVRPTKIPTQSRFSWNAGGPHPHATPPAKGDRPDTYDARAADPERVNGLGSEALAVNNVRPDSDNNSFVTAQNAPEPLVTNRPGDTDISMPIVQPDPSPATDASSGRNRPPLPLQARIGRALRSVVLQNAKLRERCDAIDLDKVQSKIDIIVTENVSEAFGAQMRKVKKEMDATRAGIQTEEVMARAKHELLNGFGNKSGIGDNRDNTWLNRRDSHSLLASTSILPTPPPSEHLAAENMDKPPPKAPRAMLRGYSPSIPSLKGKEKAVDPVEEDAGSAKERRDNYSRPNLRAEPMQKISLDRSPRRRVSVSPSRSFGSHRRGFTEDELPRYRSPPRSRINRSPQDRKGSLRTSHSPVRTNYSHSPARSGRRLSPRARSRSRPPRSRSRLRRADSHTRSFNSRRPSFRSVSRSPPPSASYSNGFPPRSFRKSCSRSTGRDLSRGRSFSGKHPPHRSRSGSQLLDSRHAPEKRPFVRSPSPVRGRRGGSILERRSRSPVPTKRKLTHPSSPRSRSPLRGNRRSPSYGRDLSPRGRLPTRNGRDGPYSTPGRNSGRGYEDSPTQLLSPFGPQPPPSTRAREFSPAPPPPNPCNNVPGLWFVKVGADTPKVLEGRFVVEPEFAATWGLLPPRSTSTLPEKSKLSVVLLCLPTEAVSALSNSLIPTNPTAETMSTAVAGLETAWPRDGTLFVGMNEQESGGKTWLPNNIDPASPLDVTNYIRPGPNVIRFIQLASMVQRTFILYASTREPTSTIPDPVSQMFENSAPIQSHDPLFNFSPSVIVS
ncbi:hypothetical protein B0H19DRAFT_1189283 [Mycena capillaripes]|nr:hypothetical protein B0H19DRAFT_1189283 [Mycena capillaripes]